MSRGFTLIELLFTAAVVFVLLAVGVPSFQNTIKNIDLTTSANDILAAFQVARSEALKNSAPASVCASSNGDSCNSEDWADGWIVFADDNGDANRAPDDDLVLVEDGMRGKVAVTVPDGQPLQSSLTYLPSGFPDTGGLAAAGNLLLCDDRQSDYYGRIVVISQTGRPVAATVSQRGDLGLTCE